MGERRSGALVGTIAIGLVGLGCLVRTLTLPWRDEEFAVGSPALVVLGLAGAALMVRAATATSSAATVRRGTWLLGALVLAYPSVLGISAAAPQNPVAALAGGVGHVPPIVLMQLVPTLAASAAVGRRHRRWESAIVLVAVASVGCSVLGAAIPDAVAVAAAGTVLWFGSLVIGPVGCGFAARGAGGPARRRALLATLAAVVPVVLLTSCVLLAAVAEPLGDDVPGSLLMLVLALAAVACGWFALAAADDGGSVLLHDGVLVAALDVLLAALAVLAAGAAALIAAGSQMPPAWAVVVGVVVAVLAGAAWLRARSWTGVVVDPASALRRDLVATGAVAEGQQRLATLQALRRHTDDPLLSLRFRVGATAWVDSSGEAAPPGGLALARTGDGAPTVTAVASHEAAVVRLTALGDCSAMLRAALLEAQVTHESQRADRAAGAERRRLQQHLHDGLQGRLLGLALSLQLSGRTMDDPAARLLVDETVESLRSMVDDVRALASGALPELLQTQGLEPALRALLAPIAPHVQLDLPTGRLAAEVESTAYFVVAEAVANAWKHAAAQQIVVRLAAEDPQRVTVTVHDDGCGGADPRAGTGLRSLAERVNAFGGSFVVRDAAPGPGARGTVVEAVLPCGS